MEKEEVHSSAELRTSEIAEEGTQMQQVQVSDTKSNGNQATQAHWQRVCAAKECTLKGVAKKAVLGTIIAVVWMLLALPTVMFYVPQEKSSESSVPMGNDLSACTQTEVYSGDVCREALQDIQSCLVGDQDDGNIYIPATGRQDEIESNTRMLILSLALLQPSQECEDAVVPFLCLYLFRLCTVNGSLLQPTSQQCSNISVNICVSEWKTAETLIGRESLPECTSPPEHDKYLNCRNASTGNNTTATNATADLQCSEDFYSDGTVCRPECGEWEEWPSSTVKTIDTLIILVAIIAGLASATVFVISCTQYKRMLKFPTSLVFYQTVSVFVLGVITLVGFVDRKRLFCSSKDLLDNFSNPTSFCTISGFTSYYILFQMTIWWFCNCAVVFWSIAFPFHCRSYQDSHLFKCIHVFVFIGGLILPVIPASVTFATGQYVQTRFPPILCFPDDADTPFYTMVLPISIFVASGVSLLAVVFYVIIGVIQSKAEIRLAQAKVLIVLVYYIILGCSTLVTVMIGLRNLTPFVDAFVKYLECEAAGTGEACDRSGFMKYSTPVPISYMIIAFLPVVNLVYTLNFRKMRHVCQRWFGHKNKPASA